MIEDGGRGQHGDLNDEKKINWDREGRKKERIEKDVMNMNDEELVRLESTHAHTCCCQLTVRIAPPC
jgi:hypothetical protein